MKLRMYLRGFGLGIIMTALVMSFGVKTQNSTMTDAQVRQRALELGMVDESTTLATPTTVKEETDTEPVDQESQENKIDEIDDNSESIDNENTKAEVAEEDVEAEEVTDVTVETVEEDNTEAEDNSSTIDSTDVITESELEDEEAKTDEAEISKPEADSKTTSSSSKDYTLSVQKGFSSDRVAKILEDAGVIDSATSFDKYLCSNGYDKKISVGTYNIPAGADYEAIARIITRSN